MTLLLRLKYINPMVYNYGDENILKLVSGDGWVSLNILNVLIAHFFFFITFRRSETSEGVKGNFCAMSIISQ